MGFRNILLTGTEYIFIGILLGEMGLEFLDRNALLQLEPFLIFGLGWIGFLFGLQFEIRQLKKMPKRFFTVTVFQSAFTFILVSSAIFLLLRQILFWKESFILIMALTLGSAASCTAPAALAIVNRSFRFTNQKLLDYLRYISAVDGLLALVFFTIALCVVPAAEITDFNLIRSLEWLGISVLMGIVPGLILIFLSKVRFSEKEFILFLVGTVMFCGGLADTLNHSPLIAGFICGILTANFCRHRLRALSTVLQAEKSIYIMLLLILGAGWDFELLSSLVIVFGYFFLRILGKVLGNILAPRLWDPGFKPPVMVGLGLISEGGLTVAIILNFQALYPLYAEILITTVIVSIFLNEWISPRLILSQFGKNHRSPKKNFSRESNFLK
jgi:Kef-type K+ transport system membrane component KefB